MGCLGGGQKAYVEKVDVLGVPPWSLFLSKNLPRFRGFFPWNFGVPRDISPNLT